ncbi:V8-like Glu-specific endopeptidase [Azospirillum brasilense]|uniref:V8-like Glu-specific endopeptidase n=1 Tax=Azospirillum brasilense TaxID=192 RepID=A0A560CRZ1_AZOBR|nr:S1 family peptidase [Azospirillum brasilense]MBK3734201.1 trypsin-like serine protease [Azospirillum brasilense]TWA87622.1 V8-like Glu-specific endopeptidase [Azospirillum brasilense]
MMRMIAGIALIALGCLSAQAARAEFTMSVPETPPESMDTEILGGYPAKPEKWPATLRFSTKAGFCTSTAIGSQTILTAAHCVGHEEKGTVQIGGYTASVTCTHHPRYTANDKDPNTAFDVALCFAETPIALPGNGRYENININPARPQIGTVLELVGYGCRQSDGKGPSGYLYEGLSAVVASSWIDTYIETLGGAAVCYGDSGGAAYINVNQYRRVIAGVNSRGDISTRSYITPIANKIVLDFIEAWAKAHNTTICGLTEPTAHCHA